MKGKNKGKTRSPEHITAMSEDHKEKLRQHILGKKKEPMSDEQKKKNI